jgi:hypothetical protein
MDISICHSICSFTAVSILTTNFVDGSVSINDCLNKYIMNQEYEYF